MELHRAIAYGARMRDRTLPALAVATIFTLGAVCGDCWGAVARSDGAELEPEPVARVAEPEPEVASEPGPALEAPEPSEAEELAAVILARYAANEAGLSSRGDMLLIWQVAETHADDLEGRVRWLRRHSRCVVARRPPDEWPAGTCRWTRYLMASGERPRGWPRRWRWTNHRAAWVELHSFALEVVTGREERRPCDGSPQTWDGRRWLAGRLEAGFVEVECLDPITGGKLRNVAYRFPRWDRAPRSAAPSTRIAQAAP